MAFFRLSLFAFALIAITNAQFPLTNPALGMNTFGGGNFPVTGGAPIGIPPITRPPFGYPGYPSYPGGYPSYPGVPSYPGYPTYPGYPSYPGQYPTYPGRPTLPGFPSYPGYPPYTPGYPSFPGYPTYPGYPSGIPPRYPPFISYA